MTGPRDSSSLSTFERICSCFYHPKFQLSGLKFPDTSYLNLTTVCEKHDVSISSNLKIMNQTNIGVNMYQVFFSYCMFSKFRVDIAITRVNQFHINSSLSCSQEVFLPEKRNWMTKYCVISFVTRQPKSADCSSKKRRRSISVLVNLPPVVVITASNYGEFILLLLGHFLRRQQLSSSTQGWWM